MVAPAGAPARAAGEDGATHRNLDVGQSVGYIDVVYADYLEHAGLDPSEIEGARVLEVGAGDNLGVALRFLADGAAQVCAVDRYETWRDDAQQRAIYAALLDGLDDRQRRRVESAVELGTTVGFDPSRLKVIEGLPIEEAVDELGAESFDLIVSRAVLEHVLDLDAAFAAMDRMLKPGGRMAHEVDLRDHDMFSGGGQNPLTFLTVPDRVYRWMGAERGLPNRVRVTYYRDVMARLGFDAEVLVTHVAGLHDERPTAKTRVRTPEQVAAAVPLVEAIRPRLLERYRVLPAADLAVAGIFLIARKPG